MKKLYLFLILTVVFILSVHAQRWTIFSNSEPGAAPEVLVTTSSTQSVTFEVTIPGIYTQDTVVKGMAFTRLRLPGGRVVNPAGSPEIPMLTYSVAIPECSDVTVTYQIVSKQNLSSGWVYPVPEIVFVPHPDGYNEQVEEFSFNAGAYTQPKGTESPASISSTGYFRDQQYAEIIINPVEFCPINKTISVIDQIEITLTFTNPVGELIQELGIFADVAESAFINYERGISPPPIEPELGPYGPYVHYVNLTDTAQACKIVCDYLIITDPKFYNNAQLYRLAKHRRDLNGYDVAIVDLSQILGLNFFYEGQLDNPPTLTYKSEQKMRTFIRRVYEGKNARHMADKRVGFVLLVGDNYAGNTGMPTSFDHNQKSPYSYEGKFASDYYFCCVTGYKVGTNAGKYDDMGDFPIGRFSVETDQHLYNMVYKTIEFEREYQPKTWRKTAGFTYGNYHDNITVSNHIIYTLKDFILEYSSENWNSKIVNWYEVNGEIRVPTLDYMNEGAAFVQYWGHGGVKTWQDTLRIDTFKVKLNNYNMTPFINTSSCQTGWFDNPPNTECLAEFLTRYDSIKGAVGYIGASRTIGALVTKPDDFFVKYLFNGSHGSIAGKLMNRWKIYNHFYPDITKQNKCAYNLFGDPALDILAEGYEVTKNVTADFPAEIKKKVRVHKGATLTAASLNVLGTLIIDDGASVVVGGIGISGLVKVYGGGTLNIANNGAIAFMKDGKLIVEESGNVVIGNNALVKFWEDGSPNLDTIPKIHVKGGGFTVGSGTTFNNIKNGIFLENSKDAQGLPLYDKNKQYNFTNCTFIHVPLIHKGCKLNITNCTFVNGSDITTSISNTSLKNCTFNYSTLTADHSALQEDYEAIKPNLFVSNSEFYGDDSNTAITINNSSGFYISNNTIEGFETGIFLDNCGITQSENGKGPTYPYDTLGFSQKIVTAFIGNDIGLCGSGIELYNTVADFRKNYIHENYFGVRLYNNSYTTFDNKNQLPFQTIADCGSIELYATSNSFPSIFRYNVIMHDDNIGNPYDPLIYWDKKQVGLTLKPVVNFNNWGMNFEPQEDLYPWKYFICDSIWYFLLKAPTCGDDETLYQTGLDYFANEDYANAETTFKELIDTYPESNLAIAAMRELFALESFTDNDYYELNSYFTSIAASDSNLFDVAEFLATRCHVKARHWQPAIDWYENRIENPPSYQDSIFAVIDLGHIHLMMEGDTLGGTRGGKHLCHYRLANMKPKSKQEYETTKTSLLATLPQTPNLAPQTPYPIPQTPHPTPLTSKNGALGDCIPNPTHGDATISYEIYKEGVVEIQIYNAMGQLVKTLPQGTLKPGSYQVKVSFAGLGRGSASADRGVYHYTLLINGKRTDAKKVVVN